MKDTTNLIKLFKQYAHAKSYHKAFTEIVDYFLIGLKYYENEEEQDKALETLNAYECKEQIPALLHEIGDLSEGFNDPLGHLYETLISKGQNRQFFTPETVAKFMALCAVTKETAARSPMCDPACGSGRIILAAASINRHLWFYGADIDPLCCKITLVNMLLHSLTGEVAHMNSLSQAFYTGYKTGSILLDGYYYPYYREFTDPNESYQWLRPVTPKPTSTFDTPFNPVKSEPMNGVQGNLFESS